MEMSEIKTADFTSGGYFKVSVVKISARSDEIKGRSYVAQWGPSHEKPILIKMENKFEKLKIFFSTALEVIHYGQSDDRIDSSKRWT